MADLERHNKIIDLLNLEEFVNIDYLCEKMYVSKSTIRRDLVDLEKKGIIVRYHGGVTLSNTSNKDSSHSFRKEENKIAKELLAAETVKLIYDNIALFLDSSTTINNLIPLLNRFKNLVIVTNGLTTALELSEFQFINTKVLGGNLLTGSSSMVGSRTTNEINNYNVDLCIISCKGLNEKGIYEASDDQAQVKNKMISNSKKTILVCDSSKFGKNLLYKSSDYAAIDVIISDQEPSEGIMKKIREYQVEFINISRKG
ncbi:DeoR/GlpR family DNA-binding transcription regulator [Vagococcus salmoninarum]|uniref:DeoR/GlpR family DNA-binding transcription regulator n=1 Tax=Vagococcus salmoninarum TaxID=2739 RepID=UPI003F961011